MEIQRSIKNEEAEKDEFVSRLFREDIPRYPLLARVAWW